jgi:hypothetical protein
MTRAAAVAFAGRTKWGEVLGNLVLAALGVVLLLVAAPELSGREPVGLWLLVLYTAYAVATTLVLAALVASTSRLPTLHEATLEGRPAVGVRAWAAPWWHANALDLGLAATGVALAAAGLAAGREWAVVGLLPGLVGLWFAVRVALVVLGRRRRPALWLTDDELVVDSPSGRARAARTSVREVRSRGGRVVVELDGAATRQACPRAWRRGTPSPAALVLDATDVGHRAADLADWLRAEVGASARIGTARAGNAATAPRTSDRHRKE